MAIKVNGPGHWLMGMVAAAAFGLAILSSIYVLIVVLTHG